MDVAINVPPAVKHLAPRLAAITGAIPATIGLTQCMCAIAKAPKAGGVVVLANNRRCTEAECGGTAAAANHRHQAQWQCRAGERQTDISEAGGGDARVGIKSIAPRI